MSIKNLLLVSLLIILAGNTAIAEDKKPEFITIKAGEVSLIDGYVFTPEAIVKIYTKTQEETKTIKAECEYKLNLAQIDIQKSNDLASSERKINEQLLNDIVISKDKIIQQKIDIIDTLEKRNSANNLKVVSGFITGSLITFTIVYFTMDMLK